MKYLLAIPFATVFALTTLAQPKPHFRMFNLGTLPGGSNSWAYAMNIHGDVIGVSDTQSGTAHVVLFSHGEVLDLGPWSSPLFAGVGFGINDSGQYIAPVPSFSFTAFPEGADVSVDAINNAGVVVGSASNSLNIQVFVYANGQVQWIPPLRSSDLANAINNRGEVVGTSSPGYYRAFLYSDGQTRNLGVLPGDQLSYGTDINDLGHVVGRSTGMDESDNILVHGFLYTNGAMAEILSPVGFPVCSPMAINNRDEIVGACTTVADLSDYRAGRGFLHADGTSYDINKLVLRRAARINCIFDINDAGWMVGTMTTRRGNTRAVLLRPTVGWRKWRSAHWPSE